MLEVAVFGDLSNSVIGATSSIAHAFGTSQLDAFRRWALADGASDSTLAWTSSALASTVAAETTAGTDKAFETIWTGCSGKASCSVTSLLAKLSAAGFVKP